MKTLLFAILPLSLLLQSCIGDDFVDDNIDPELRITTRIDSLQVNSSFEFEAQYLNNIGRVEEVPLNWSSSDGSVVSINDQGNASAISVGSTSIMVSYEQDGTEYSDQLDLKIVEEEVVVNQNIKEGQIVTTSSYVLEGDFSFEETDSGVLINIADNYKASTALPGLYLYLSNNRNSISNAFEVSKVTTFNGAHTYEIDGVGFNEFAYLVYFCKPFNVKVGEAEL